MKNILPLLFISFSTFHSLGQSNQIIKKKYHDGKFNQQDTTSGYAEAVLVDNMLYISGGLAEELSLNSFKKFMPASAIF